MIGKITEDRKIPLPHPDDHSSVSVDPVEQIQSYFLCFSLGTKI